MLKELGATLAIDGFVERLRAALAENPSRETLVAVKPFGANPVALGIVREVTIRDIEVDAERLLQRLVC
ncbi:hypothetical protein [Rhizobium sp. BK176]|uniref:hypothetical protein n=1 Tax=Rhizobium sp. BK176 TaxID=2587071 RepID=UPI0021680600|nr:hypothetical protein [Rhizobium sp. BK176]MCS4089789.1 hypothetical protein [Rhizobium sp. BK176]